VSRTINVNYLTPVASLKHFTKLKRLFIPQAALINATSTEVAPSHPLDILPSNLEFMQIYDPTPAVINWLSGILDDRAKLPRLSAALLDFGHRKGNKLSNFMDPNREAGTRLYKSGLDILYTNDYWMRK
jgi:hypothetical protein